MSFHLPHLLLESNSSTTNSPSAVDRKFIDHFEPKGSTRSNDNKYHLYKASSSVLLTIATPEEQSSREEEHNLLANPQALWNVIILNGSWRMASTSNRDPLEYQTPLAQFVRGICSAVISQRTNILPIIHELEERLRDSEDDNLFDDRQFSKSRTYHWIIKTCHDICTSIQINLKFLRDVRTNRLPELRQKAHEYEKPGLEYWIMKLREEISELDKVQMEVNALREQIRELRDALHGATALLESRIAVMQGDRIKTLTYLSIAYIPLSTVSSVYSMSVLPAGANLTSYFIVLAVIAILTLIAAIILQKNSSINAEPNVKQSPTTPSSAKPSEHFPSLLELGIRLRGKSWKLLLRATNELRLFVSDINDEAYTVTDNKFLFPLVFAPYFIFYGIAALIWYFIKGMKYLLWDFPWNELGYTFDLLYRPPASVLNPRWFSVRKLVLDLIRFALLPVWLALVLVRGILMLVAILFGGCFMLMSRMVRWVYRKCGECGSSR